MKELQQSGYARHIVDPDENLTYSIVQAYVSEHLPTVPTPLIANWSKSPGIVPRGFSYTSMYEYLLKREITILARDGVEIDRLPLPVADKPLVKGFNFYGSGHVGDMKFNVTGNICHAWGHVTASMKQQRYLTKVALDASGIIMTASCECPAGQGGKCNHVAAVLFWILDHKDLQAPQSCTEQPQAWHQPSSAAKKKIKPTKIGTSIYIYVMAF